MPASKSLSLRLGSTCMKCGSPSKMYRGHSQKIDPRVRLQCAGALRLNRLQPLYSSDHVFRGSTRNGEIGIFERMATMGNPKMNLMGISTMIY